MGSGGPPSSTGPLPDHVLSGSTGLTPRGRFLFYPRQLCTRRQLGYLEEPRLTPFVWSRQSQLQSPEGTEEENSETQLRYEFKDALYNGRMRPRPKESIAVLLPNQKQPQDWRQTRPITLSSSSCSGRAN